jgi:tetratricopeptide (TPR) repeat protein
MIVMVNKFAERKSPLRLCAVIWVTTLMLGAQFSSAAAATSNEIAAAERHNRAGVQYYSAGKFSDAVHETLLAYQLVPDSRLIFNIARIYHKMSEYQLAVQHYDKYLLSSNVDDLLVKKALNYKNQALKARSSRSNLAGPDINESLFLLSEQANASTRPGKKSAVQNSFVLRLAPPLRATGSKARPKQTVRLNLALEKVIARRPGQLMLSPQGPVHLRLISYEKRLVFMPSGSTWPKELKGADLNRYIDTHFLSVQLNNQKREALVDVIDDVLWRVTKVHQLLEITEAMNSQPTLVGTIIEKGSIDKTQLLSATKESELRHGDRLTVKITNLGKSASDVTVLYIDSHYGITAIFPLGQDAAEARVGPGAQKLVFDGNIDTSETKGLEHLIVIAAPVQVGDLSRTFTMLEQESPGLTRGEVVGERPQDTLLKFLNDARTSGSRGVSRNKRASAISPAISVYTWKTSD